MSFYDDASWLLIPEGIEEDIVFAQKPTNGLGDLTFTRASDATRTNSAGVIERTPWNLLQQSEMFSQSPWNINRISAFGSGSIVNDTIAPNGTLTADYIQQASGQTLTGGVFVQVSYILGQSYTLSVYAKKKENNYLRLGFAIGTGQVGLFGNFDLNTGVPGTPDVGVTQTIQDVGNGWYRCSITATSQVTTTSNTFIYNSSTLNSSTTTPLQGIYIWGAQLVEGTDAKPYFATTNRQDVPRLDYRNADGSLNSCPRLLLEPQRTNSIRNSSMVGAVAGSPGTLPTNWVFGGSGGLTRSITAVGVENGIQYIDVRHQGTAVSTATAIRFESSQQMAASNGQTWTKSVYLKLTSSAPNNTRIVIEERTSTGVFITEGASPNLSITNALNRFNLTRTLVGGATVAFVNSYIIFDLTIGATYDFTIRIAAPQMELGATASTFIPTTTAAVTRLADAASKTGVSSIIGQTEGTLFLDFEGGANDSTEYIFGVNDGTTNNRILIYRGNNNRIVSQVRFGGTIQALISTLTVTPDTRHKCAVAYKANDVAFYVNGVQVGVDTLASIPTCSVISMDAGVGGVPFYRPVNQAALFPTRLTNAQLAQLTTL